MTSSIDHLFEIPGLESLGFSQKRTGGHMARSMMFTEIRNLFSVTPPDYGRAEYKTEIVENNVLGKPTSSSRKKSYSHLVELYGLDPSQTLFRCLRFFANDDFDALAQLALVCVYCRDPQFRQSFELIEKLAPGEELPRVRMEQHLEEGFPGRFSAAMKKSLAQNVNTSWGVAGFLQGRNRKYRTDPRSSMSGTVYAVFAGHLLGLRGDFLLNSSFTRLVGANESLVISHLSSASTQGWLRFRHSGGITEIDFEPLLERYLEEVASGTN